MRRKDFSLILYFVGWIDFYEVVRGSDRVGDAVQEGPDTAQQTPVLH